MADFSPHGNDIFGEAVLKKHGSTLGDRFMIPPFTVLNAREGWWQERKAAWIGMGIKSEIGRGETTADGGNLLGFSAAAQGKGYKALEEKDALLFSGKAQNRLNDIMNEGKPVKPKDDGAQDDMFGKPEAKASEGMIGTSIFDPVLCELAYRWWCPPGGAIIDPFAGGSVRGIVASMLGYRYWGCDLATPQIEANRAQAETICGDGMRPEWFNGDSRGIYSAFRETYGNVRQADFIFSCPPYADLERYSDDPADLSTLSYKSFREAYEYIIGETCKLLKPNRFACFVVGDVRGDDGYYYGFQNHTVDAFEKAGLRFYNEAILVTAVGSLPIRAKRQFDGGRKLGRTHQAVLMFCKGDWRKATQACLGKAL